MRPDFLGIFCMKGIRRDRSRNHPLDPCALVLVGNADQDEQHPKAQTFFCHFACFRKVVGDDRLLYIIESLIDVPTKREHAARQVRRRGERPSGQQQRSPDKQESESGDGGLAH
jgi:hypothetical protein